MDRLAPSLSIITPPEAEPVSVADLKAHLRLNTDDEDDLLAGFLAAARELFEAETGRAVLPTTYRQSMACWSSPLRLLRGPVLSVESVKYHDRDDDEQELEVFGTDLSGLPGIVYAASWPALSSTRPRPVAVEFVAGWPDADAVPAGVRLAILLQAAHYYENREAQSDTSLNETPDGFRRVCDQWRTGIGGW